ncbi:hypothetical protein [Flavobacterium sp. UMI-01]|uniref:hypothetical protein n=1 Tax=Flavobacterium sp. UMI-01 TaxID=1441053 RepID=UPI001C7CC492|nr:hypothetical protein [Flavobacterium sp. UMI-01]
MSYFCNMAYNKKNYNKRAQFIIDVYKNAKHDDVPDTKIIRTVFPKFNIYISYRQWMNIKGMPIPKENQNQLSLFGT